MGKLNIALLIAVLACALKIVEVQHASRTLFVEYGREQHLAEQLDVAYSKLLLSQASLATGQRIDQVARNQLGMSPPAQNQIVYMTLKQRWPDD